MPLSGLYPVLGNQLVVNPRRACAARVTVVVLCTCLSVCLSVSPHTILAVRAITGKTEDTIVLSVEFEAIVKWRFS